MVRPTARFYPIRGLRGRVALVIELSAGKIVNSFVDRLRLPVRTGVSLFIRKSMYARVIRDVWRRDYALYFSEGKRLRSHGERRSGNSAAVCTQRRSAVAWPQ